MRLYFAHSRSSAFCFANGWNVLESDLASNFRGMEPSRDRQGAVICETAPFLVLAREPVSYRGLIVGFYIIDDENYRSYAAPRKRGRSAE